MKDLIYKNPWAIAVLGITLVTGGIFAWRDKNSHEIPTVSIGDRNVITKSEVGDFWFSALGGFDIEPVAMDPTYELLSHADWVEFSHKWVTYKFEWGIQYEVNRSDCDDYADLARGRFKTHFNSSNNVKSAPAIMEVVYLHRDNYYHSINAIFTKDKEGNLTIRFYEPQGYGDEVWLTETEFKSIIFVRIG